MSLLNRMSAMFRRFRKRRDLPACEHHLTPELVAVVGAQGAWIALLAAILEREGVVSVADLARTLGEFADLTAEERRVESEILASWAARLHDTAAIRRDFPSIH